MIEERKTVAGLGEIRGVAKRLPSRLNAAMAIVDPIRSDRHLPPTAYPLRRSTNLR